MFTFSVFSINLSLKKQKMLLKLSFFKTQKLQAERCYITVFVVFFTTQSIWIVLVCTYIKDPFTLFLDSSRQREIKLEY